MNKAAMNPYCARVFSFLLGKHVGMQLLGHVVSAYLIV